MEVPSVLGAIQLSVKKELFVFCAGLISKEDMSK